MADRIEHISPDTMGIKARTGRAILSKGRLLITTVIIILLMGYCLIGGNYLKQLKEQKALTVQIAEVTQTLRGIAKLPADLEQRLAEAEGSFAAEQGLFPSKINTTQVINTILGLAQSRGVNATPMVTQPWTTEKVGKHSYQVLRLTIAVEGTFSQLVNFASSLEEGSYTTLVMENLSATKNSEQSEEGTTTFTGNLKLAIYTQPSSSD
jgi:Tfp pilus assembly protein PilO